MPSGFFFLSLGKKHRIANPATLVGGKNFTRDITSHIQLHSSQKTVYACSPYRTYFKVTKYIFFLSTVVFLLPIRRRFFFFCPFMVHKYQRKVVLEIFMSRSSSLVAIHLLGFHVRSKGQPTQFSFSLHPRAFFPNLYTNRRPSTRSKISRL